MSLWYFRARSWVFGISLIACLRDDQRLETHIRTIPPKNIPTITTTVFPKISSILGGLFCFMGGSLKKKPLAGPRGLRGLYYYYYYLKYSGKE